MKEIRPLYEGDAAGSAEWNCAGEMILSRSLSAEQIVEDVIMLNSVTGEIGNVA